MRRSLLLATSALLCSVPAFSSAIAQSDTLLSTLKTRNKQIDDAFLKGDPAAMRGLFSPSATIINPAGGSVNPETLFSTVSSGALKYTAIERSEEKLVQYGNIAILTSLTNDSGTMQGHDISGKYRWTEVWAQEGGQWRIVAAQGTSVAPQP